MANEWQKSTWGDEISLEYGKGIRGYKDASGPYSVYGSNGPVGKTSVPLAPGPGVILGRKGAYRGVEYSKDPFFVIDTAYYVKPKNKLNMRWVYYAMKYHRLGEIDDGSPIPSTTRSAVYVRELHVPPVSVQHRIADILGKLDDKIELNRRMNRTLEKMAAAIFKSWFIDFDPVHAKAEGRYPNLPAEIADLFPDTFEDSDLGPIPKGWACSTIGKEFNLTMGQSPPGETYNESREGIPFFQGRRDFGFRYPTNRVYCTAPTRYATRGDTLISVRAPVGDINMAIDQCSIGRGVAAARHKSTTVSYTYYACRSLRDRFEVYNGEGTVFGSVSQRDFRAIPWLAPDNKVISSFDQIVGPIDQRIETNEIQNRNLGRLRDALLPKLLSGEIGLPTIDAGPK